MKKNRVCPVENAGSLDNRFRRWLQNPKKILHPYLKKGMTALDLGCGPGFFSADMAQMVGRSGRVIATDLQEGMLRKLEKKIKGTELEKRIILHQCSEDKIGILEQVDFVLAFYVIHEIPHQDMVFQELLTLLKTGGIIFMAEPPFHVSKRAFQQTIIKAQEAGLMVYERPKVLFSKTVLLKKS